jgi:pimeloyl-ACP methyl ester carboxylesterase
MGGRIYDFDAPDLPAQDHNNLWRIDRNSDHVIVFVHGVLSDSRGCWYREPDGAFPGVYWPDLVRDDRRFSNFSIYLGGYHTSVTSGPYEVSDCAEELFNALRDREEGDRARSVLEHKTTVFVCHSMGGIVVRYMLTMRPWEFKDKRIGLALVASPSAGSPWADRLSLLIDYFHHEQGKELKWGNNWRLEDLDGRFRTLLHDKGIAKLYGAEACEQRFVLDKKWFPPLTPVVPKDSAGAYFGRVEMFPDTDHFTCVKPKDKDDPAHRFLVRFCSKITSGDTATVVPTLPAEPQPPVAPPSPVRDCTCQSLHWDVKIDEEGDAYNEMTYRGIVLPSLRPYVFNLPAAEVQSGHTTPFELIWRDGRTTEGGSLHDGKVVGPTRIEMYMQFQDRPTNNNPAGFAIRAWDWNVYSMNMEEYRQKQNWREDGHDCAEKYIPESWQRFAMVVQFPPQIVLTKDPFFAVYDYPDGESSDPDGVRNDKLTDAYQHCFSYSPFFRQALLFVERPAAGHSYRISWLLGESGTSVASALMPLQRQRQRAFASALLGIRRALESADPAKSEAARQLAECVNSVLASVAEHVQKLAGGAPLDPSSLEISLMVLDEEQLKKPAIGDKAYPCLRIAAGTHFSDPDYRDLSLFVGDGNAGRAWKRRMARIFDPADKNPKNRIYVPVSKSLSHRFLISLPLIDPESDALVFGILNIGTFDVAQAEILRPLAGDKEMEEIGNHAHSFVLKRLLELIKL